MPTAAEFTRALNALPTPSPRMQNLLRAHADAPNQVSDARHLAEVAGYKDWRGVNLQYGLLGKRIAQKLGRTPQDLCLLVEFMEPNKLSNGEYLVLMKPAFMKAVKKTTWF